MLDSKSSQIAAAATSIALGTIAGLTVYWLTAYPTIAWWSSAELAVAAHDLGVMSPPGAVIPTILGWVVMHLPLGGSAILRLNFFAGILAVATCWFVVAAALSVWRTDSINHPHTRPLPLVVTAASLAAGLTVAFGETLWNYAIQYTTYIVTPLFTALILWAMIRWWRSVETKSETKWLFVTALLFGLDLSVHRTNSLLFPGFIVWVLILHPRSYLSLRNWAYCLGGLFLGLAFHMVLIPMAKAEPFMNMTDPSSLSGFWDYVSLKMRGGGFLLNVWPRNAEFWSVQVQDWVDTFGSTYVHRNGLLGPLGVLPAVLGIYGIKEMLQRRRKLAVAMLVLFACTSLGTIIYFNIPENYFRSLHRHYLPSLVVFGVLVVYGAARLFSLPSGARAGLRPYIEPLIIVVVLLLPVNQISRNFNKLDASETRFAHEYAMNLFRTLPENAILLTTGDNDTFPLWYLQEVEGVRRDVAVLNLSILNTSWFVKQVMTWETAVPAPFTEADIENWSVRPWADTTVVFGVAKDNGLANLPDSVVVPDSVAWDVGPTIFEQYFLAQDWFVLRMLQANRWRRPVYTVDLGSGRLPWLQDHLMQEGLLYQVVPLNDVDINVELSEELVLRGYEYASFLNPKSHVDRATNMQAVNYFMVFSRVIHALRETGRAEAAEEACGLLSEAIPPDRFDISPRLLDAREQLCERPGGSGSAQ